jgi:hypothetical protein
VRITPINPGHEGCGAAGELCTNPQCDKDPDSVSAGEKKAAS